MGPSVAVIAWRSTASPTRQLEACCSRDYFASVCTEIFGAPVMHQVESKLVHANIQQPSKPLYVPLDGSEQTEPVDDVVRYEVDRRVVRSAVVAVVVPLTAPHVFR